MAYNNIRIAAVASNQKSRNDFVGVLHRLETPCPIVGSLSTRWAPNATGGPRDCDRVQWLWGSKKASEYMTPQDSATEGEGWRPWGVQCQVHCTPLIQAGTIAAVHSQEGGVARRVRRRIWACSEAWVIMGPTLVWVSFVYKLHWQHDDGSSRITSIVLNRMQLRETLRKTSSLPRTCASIPSYTHQPSFRQAEVDHGIPHSM